VRVNRLSYKLPKDLHAAVEASLADWKNNNKVARLWQKDAALCAFTSARISNRAWAPWERLFQRR
jgi:hypothetical protein